MKSIKRFIKHILRKVTKFHQTYKQTQRKVTIRIKQIKKEKEI